MPAIWTPTRWKSSGSAGEQGPDPHSTPNGLAAAVTANGPVANATSAKQERLTECASVGKNLPAIGHRPARHHPQPAKVKVFKRILGCGSPVRSRRFAP